MRAAPKVEKRRPSPLRWWIIGVVAAVLVVGFIVVPQLAVFFTDYWWFDGLGQGGTWRSLLLARILPAVAFMGFFFVVMYVNLVIADRLAPKAKVPGQRDELVERYQDLSRKYSGRIKVGVSLFFALVAGANLASQWQSWVLFWNAQDFGRTDPLFNRDIGFYVFRLPFIETFINWMFASLAIVFVIMLVVHYLNGGIRVQTPFQRVSPQVKAHFSVLLAVMALVKALEYYFAQFALTNSTRGFVQGATYTDVNAQLPALRLLIVIALVAVVLFVVNIWRKGWVLPIIAVGLWGLISIVVGTIYPAVVQRFQVEPDEQAKERPYIEDNIEGTRDAFGLSDVEVVGYPYRENLTSQQVQAAKPTLDNVRLWDPIPLQPGFERLQSFEPQYAFRNVDADRYKVDGVVVPVMSSARELDEGQIPSKTWVSQHLLYTSGYGSVVARANDVAPAGPSFLLGDLPPEGVIDTAEDNQVYVGEGLAGYVVADTKQAEYVPAQARVEGEPARFEGDTGVRLSSIWRRTFSAIRFSELNIFVSDRITEDSQLLFRRDVRERVQELAPFLQFDADPYIVVADGRQQWVIDGYTVTTNYPYSEAFNPSTAPPTEVSGESGLNGRFNYVRNSVKAVVDAATGSVTFFVVDEEDPIIKAYARAFPDLFTDLDEASDDLVSHFRYPEDIFRVQTTMYAQYHVLDPDAFFAREDLWSVQQDPEASEADVAVAAANTLTTTTVPRGAGSDKLKVSTRRIDPIYLMMEMPGDESRKQQFLLSRPFELFGKSNELTSYMVARNDLTKDEWKTQAGKLTAYDFRVADDGGTTEGTPSPVRFFGEARTNPDIQSVFTLLGTRTKVLYGQVQLVPVGDSILYFQPVYVQNDQAGGYPRFRFIMAGYGSTTVIHTSVEAAVQQIFFNGPPLSEEQAEDLAAGTGDAVAPSEDASVTTTTTTTAPATTVAPVEGDEAELLRQLAAAADEYEKAKNQTPVDLARIQRAADEMARIIAALNEAEGI